MGGGVKGDYGGGGRGIWRGEEGNGAPQSATCCTICERGCVRIGRERFENSGSIFGRHRKSFSSSRRAVEISTFFHFTTF